jgi:hypothetical protein
MATLLAQTPAAPRATLERLSDTEFWTLVSDASELGGAFHSDNFTSNEANFPSVAARLAASGPHGGAYLGVGPEQNFHYIAAIRPAIAIVFDIRQQAVMQHLLYKALFELSDSREAFIARLFSVPVPAHVDRRALPDALWQKFAIGPGDDRARLTANITEVEQLLMETHGFKLTDADRQSLEYVYEAFFKFGPEIDYSGGVKGLTTANMNFAKLAAAVDAAGVPRSFLGTDELYQVVRSLEIRNLVVPVQADFGGPKAIRAVGDFLRAHGLRVSAFYISNVEQYLFNPRSPIALGGQETNGGWRAFYDNLATLPANAATVLLRVPVGPVSVNGTPVVVHRRLPDGTISVERREDAPFCPLLAFLDAVRAGKVTTQSQATSCGQ